MKRILAFAIALMVLFGSALAEPMGTFDFTDDILGDGSPIYYFQDLSLRLPASWLGKIIPIIGDDGVSFYQRASYERYQAEGIDGGGFLFRLGASVNGSFSALPSFMYLGFSERSCMNYYLELPTDYPAYMETGIREEYDAMCAQIDAVAQNAAIYPPEGEAKDGDDDNLAAIDCPEQGFSTKADPAYSWDYQEGNGITIYTGSAGSIPYVTVYSSGDLIAEPLEFIREQYTPHMKSRYGKDLVSFTEYDEYKVGGKLLPAGLYTYRLQGYLIDMLRVLDSTGGHTVAFTAKYVQGKGADTLRALDTAVRCFREE